MFSFYQERDRERGRERARVKDNNRQTEGQWKGASEFLIGVDEACCFGQCFKIAMLYIL